MSLQKSKRITLQEFQTKQNHQSQTNLILGPPQKQQDSAYKHTNKRKAMILALYYYFNSHKFSTLKVLLLEIPSEFWQLFQIKYNDNSKKK